MKGCIKCNEVKPLSSFHRHKGMKDGHLNKCSSCVVEDVALWRKNNPDCRKQEHARKREKRGFKTREQWLIDLKANSIGRRASISKYMIKRRIQTEKHLTELDEFVINEAHKLATEREEGTGFAWHVDHIVPLNHKDVCGLHVVHNIQVVPAVWNLKKGNRNMEEYKYGI